MKPKRPITIVSVDWDYFLPHEIDTCDWGHNESNGFFYEAIWPLRADNHFLTSDPTVKDRTAFDVIQVSPKRVGGFWDSIMPPTHTVFASCICDSHKNIVQWLEAIFTSGETFRIINFDAHHDAGYAERGKSILPLNCGNWAAFLKDQKRLLDYTVIYPEWRQAHPEFHDAAPPYIDRIGHGKWKGEPLCPLAIFLCRSSCWMPPWCDAGFIQLARKLRARTFDDNVVTGSYDVEKARPFTRMEPVDWRKVAAQPTVKS